jgi:hypothetical protein
MSWRQIDYHGSRSYAADEGEGVTVGNFSLLVAWLAAFAQRQLEGLMRFGSRQPKPAVLLLDSKEKRFSVLGGRHRPVRADDCPFPVLKGEHQQPKGLDRR